MLLEETVSAQLARTLGPLAIWGLGVGYVISGMYFGWNLGLPEGGPYGMLVATAAVTVMYAAFVLGYAELACAMPRAGGAFVYATRAFGAHVGFVAGIAQLVEYALSPPAIAIAIGSYINQAAPDVPVLGVAIAAYVTFTIVNAIGVALSAAFELVLTVLAVVELCVFGAVVLPHFSWAQFSADALPNGWSGAFAAAPFAIWFYLAIEGIANVAEDARAPQRDLPRGFFAALATLVALTAIALFGAVGVDGWRAVVIPDAAHPDATSDSPLPLAIAHVVDRSSPFFYALTGIGLVGLVASFHGILVAASRALLELGRVGYAPRALGAIHPVRKTPIAALVANGVIGFVALATGKTADIIYLAVFGALTLYVVSSAAVIVLRHREPALERPFRTPLYPIAPAVAFVIALACIAAMVGSHPRIALVYAAIVGGSWLAFVVLVPASRRARF